MTSLDDPSGLSIAEEAHAAGAVEPQDHTPTCRIEVTIEAMMNGADARRMTTGLAAELLSRSDVTEVVWSVQERG